MVMPRIHLSGIVLALLLLLCVCAEVTDIGALVPPTADQDPELPQMNVSVAGHSRAIHIETYGDKNAPVLLVMHGSYGDFRSFRNFQSLADNYFVVLWDQRGSGLSERITEDEYTFDSIVDEIGVLKETFSPNSPITLVGHSFGAMYAALYAGQRAQNVSQLVLIEPGGLTGDIFTETFDQIFNQKLFHPNLSRVFWQSETLSASDHEAMDYKAVLLLNDGAQVNYYCDPDNLPDLPIWRPGAYLEVLRAKILGSINHFEFDFVGSLGSFPRKILILGSDCSALGYEYQQQWHQPLFPDADVVQITQAGHRLFVEQPEQMFTAIRNYLNAYNP